MAEPVPVTPLPVVRRIAADHPAIAGHFPGDPLVPGVLILEEVYDVAVATFGPSRLVGVRQVKFLAPLRPGEDFQVMLKVERGGSIGFTCTRGQHTLAQGQLLLAVEPVDD